MATQKSIKPETQSEVTLESAKVSYHLSADTGLTIHTKRAQSLCRGSWKYSEMGLFQFAKVMHVAHQSSLNDDPYADWHIEKIQSELLKIKESAQSAIADYDKKIEQWRGLQIKVFGSQNPQQFMVKFSNPSGYLAAGVIGELDYLFRQSYTFRKLGIFAESAQVSNQFFSNFKSVLANSRQWRHTGVTRQDIREKNQKAKRATSLLGKVPLRVLNKQK